MTSVRRWSVVAASSLADQPRPCRVLLAAILFTALACSDHTTRGAARVYVTAVHNGLTATDVSRLRVWILQPASVQDPLQAGTILDGLPGSFHKDLTKEDGHWVATFLNLQPGQYTLIAKAYTGLPGAETEAYSGEVGDLHRGALAARLDTSLGWA